MSRITEDDIVHRLEASQNRAKSFYLNGPPRTGKSYLLGTIKRALPSIHPRTQVIGPYVCNSSGLSALATAILRELQPGYFDDPLPSPDTSLVAAWQWFGAHAAIAVPRSFLVLVDLEREPQPDLDSISAFFSSARDLEGCWRHQFIRVQHLIAGFWDHHKLKRYYQERLHISFPYTVSDNYVEWQGISHAEIAALLRQNRPEGEIELDATLVNELTNGHPGAIVEVFEQLSGKEFTLGNLLTAVRVCAAEGETSQAFVAAWRQIGEDACSTLARLTASRHLPARADSLQVAPLIQAGLGKMEGIGSSTYLGFASWFAELVVRLHLAELGISQDQSEPMPDRLLMPETSALNVEAYRVINQIENTARNFVTMYWREQRRTDEGILVGHGKKYDPDTRSFSDADARARGWLLRSTELGMPVDLNPEIAYSSTNDLADLVREIAGDSKSEAWHRIADKISDLKYVRDAVMHNQLIDHRVLVRLYDLQDQVYRALEKR